MPSYTYNCTNCSKNFDYFHSLSEKKEQCEECKTKTLNKVPTINLNLKIKREDKQKVGSLVETAIVDGREELEKQKKELKEKEYK